MNTRTDLQANVLIGLFIATAAGAQTNTGVAPPAAWRSSVAVLAVAAGVSTCCSVRHSVDNR